MKLQKRVNRYLNRFTREIRSWAEGHFYQLALFNVFLMFLILLRSAGYFSPFFPLTVNFIVFLSILFSVFLLGFRSQHIFFLAVVFWLLAGLFRIGAIEVWAERAALYTYQALVLGVLLLIVESIFLERKTSAR